MRRSAGIVGAGAVAVLSAAWLLWPPPPAVSRPDLRGANLLLVTIDTLRPDRLGVYGGVKGLTPTLDALASRGVLFTHAWSHVPMTLPAHASILTGLVPPHHGVRNNGSFHLGPAFPTLAERLQAAGYRTGAFVGAFVLDARFGLNRGFDEYDDRFVDARQSASFHFVERPADAVLRNATAWITRLRSGGSGGSGRSGRSIGSGRSGGSGRSEGSDGSGGSGAVADPWFAWVHLFDPHAPYRAAADYARSRTPYDGEVAWTDAALGAALKDLERQGALSRTVIVITADHGESLGEHGETTHGLFAYDATLRVPLIIVAPGVGPRAVSAPTGHVDILPTILDLLGLESAAVVDGRSRVADMTGASSEPAAVYFEALDANLTRGWAPLSGVVADGWKYIELPEPELYDLHADPAEQANVAAREPARVRALESRLRQWNARKDVQVSRAVDASEAARLQSLGYVAASPAPRKVFRDADDPKRLVAVSEAFNTALDDASNGRADAALAAFAEVLERRPDFLAARLSAATVLITSNRPADALRLLQAAPVEDRAGSAWLTKMGQAHAAAGDLENARVMLASAAASAHGDPAPLNDLGVVLLRMGRRDEARAAFQRLLEIDPTATGTWYNLGLLEMDARRSAPAAEAFQRVVDLDPRHVDAWRGLGAALVSSDLPRAADAWRRAVELEPGDADTQYNLRMLMQEMKRP